MTSREIRKAARENLTGNWGISVGVALVAALLGGMIAGAGSGINWNIHADDVRDLPRALWGVIMPIVSVAGVMGLVSFIIGGVVELGYAKFLLKQYNHQQLQFSDLFSQFDQHGLCSEISEDSVHHAVDAAVHHSRYCEGAQLCHDTLHSGGASGNDGFGGHQRLQENDGWT